MTQHKQLFRSSLKNDRTIPGLTAIAVKLIADRKMVKAADDSRA